MFLRPSAMVPQQPTYTTVVREEVDYDDQSMPLSVNDAIGK